MVSSAVTGAGSIGTQDSNINQAVRTNGSGTDFSAILSKSVANNMSGSNKNNSSSMNITTTTSKKTDTDIKANMKNTSSDKTDTDNTAKNKAVRVNDAADDNAKEQVSDKLQESGSKIYDEIKKNFDVTDEQLNEAMETLGLTMADLLIPANITQLVVEVTGSQDAMAIVTDDNLSANLMNVMDMLDKELASLSSELDMPVETIKAVIENAGVEVLPEASDNIDTTHEEAVADKADYAVESNTTASDDVQNKDVSMSDVIARKLVVNEDDKQSNAGTGEDRSNTYGRDNDILQNDNIAITSGNVVNDIQESFAAAFDNADYNVNPVDVVDQVIESIKLNSTSELKSMEIQLNPQNLGKVNLLVSVREGVVTAQISAENEQVKKALESQVVTLKENIQNQGIKIDAVEVTVQSNAFDANQQFDGQKQEQSRKTSRRIRLDGLEYSEDDEEEEAVTNYNENSSVEYTA